MLRLLLKRTKQTTLTVSRDNDDVITAPDNDDVIAAPDNDDVIAAPVCLLPPGVPSDGAGRGVGLSERGRNE